MQGKTRGVQRSLLVWLVAAGCGVAQTGPDGEPGPLAGFDDGAEPPDGEPEPDGDEPPVPDDGDDPPDEPGDPSCATTECPSERPICSDDGQCIQCLDVLDCDAAACVSGECTALPTEGRITWLRAADLALGTPVSSWFGAGGGAAAVQPDAERQPWVASPPGAGLTTVWFDGEDDRLDLDDGGAFASGDARTIVAVVVTEGDGHVFGTAADDGGAGLTVEQGRPRVPHGDAEPLWPARHLLAGVPRIVSVRADANGASLRLEGSLSALSAVSSSPIATDPSTLGASFDGAAPAFHGGIGELLVYDRALSDVELELIEGYLAQRHAIAPPDPWATMGADVTVFYPLDEVGPGPRADTLGNLALSPFPGVDGITAVPGVVGQAQHIDGAYGGYHFFRNGAGPQLDHSTESFTWAGWAAIDPVDAADPYLVPQTLVGKWDPPSTCQVRVWYEPGSRQWSLSVSPTGQEQDAVTLTHPTAVPPGEFALVQAWRDAMRGELGLRVGLVGQMGMAVTLPMAESMPSVANDLNVAAHATCSDGFLQGTVDALGQWHRPLTEAESAVLVDGFEPG